MTEKLATVADFGQPSEVRWRAARMERTQPINNTTIEPRSPAQIGFFLIAFLILVSSRLWHLTSTCLWFDEVFSVHAARHGWNDLFKFVAADIIHPPLFYAVLKLWIGAGGESLFWLRLLPLTLALATVVPFYFLARELKLRPADTNLSLLLIAVSGFLIKYAQEVRMYSLLLFLSVTSIWLFLRFVRRDSSARTALLLLTACNLSLVYTHYYGWLLIVSEVFILLMWHRKRSAMFLLTVAGLVVAFLPWIYAVAVFREPGKGLSQNIGWIARPGLATIWEFFVHLSKPFLFSQSTLDRADGVLFGYLILLFVGAAIVAFIARLGIARRLDKSHKALLVFVLAPVVLAAASSWLLPYSIWGERHLIICAVPFFLLVALAVNNLRPHWMKLALLIMFACVVLLAGAIYLLKPAPALSWCAWDQMIGQPRVTSQRQPTGVVYTFEDIVAYHIWFASTHTPTHSLTIKVVEGLPEVPEDPAYFLPRRFNEIEVVPPSAITGDNIWIAYRARRWDENRPPVSYLKALGYQQRDVRAAAAEGEQVFLVEFTRVQPSTAR